jgi:hypothetical protein
MKRHEKCRTNFWFLLHENAPAFRSIVVQGFLSEEQCENTGTSHLSQADFYLFPRLKAVVKGWRFCDISDIFKNAMKELKMF